MNIFKWIKRKWKGLRRKISIKMYPNDDVKYLTLRFKINFGYKPNIQNPQTFNEKLLWLKLYWRDDRCYRLVDKYDVREYVKECGLEKILVQNYGMFERFEEFDRAQLPFPCCIKVTHDSGGVWIVKSQEEYEKKKKDILNHFNRKVYNHGREWPYYHVKPRIIVEEVIQTKDEKLPWDYKIFCFHGKAKFLFVATQRPQDTRFDFFDIEWNHLDVKNGHPNSSFPIPKPEKWEEMIKVAEKLASDFPHVRVDLYYENGKIYFGEMTFFHFGGNVPFEPAKYDLEFGKYLVLPKANHNPYEK